MKIAYENENVTLWHGDCREVIPTLQGVDGVVTDPPYGVGLSAKRAKQRGGGVTVREGSYCMDDTPEYVASVVVPVVNLCRERFAFTVLTPGTRNLWKYPDAEDMGCFFSAAGTGMGRWGFTCCQPILYYGKDPYLARCMGSRANSCGQTYPNDANEQGHPCAKPIRMMRWLVNRASLEGMTLCDPFCGSGTTLIAALETGRKAIGIEIDERWVAVARQRLERWHAQGRLDFGTANNALCVKTHSKETP